MTKPSAQYRARLKGVSRLRECCRQGQAEVVSKSGNKIPQTWGPPFNLALYMRAVNIGVILELTPKQLKTRLAASAKSRSALMPSGYLTVDWVTYPLGDVDRLSLYCSPVRIITRNSEEPEDLRLNGWNLFSSV